MKQKISEKAICKCNILVLFNIFTYHACDSQGIGTYLLNTCVVLASRNVTKKPHIVRTSYDALNQLIQTRGAAREKFLRTKTPCSTESLLHNPKC